MDYGNINRIKNPGKSSKKEPFSDIEKYFVVRMVVNCSVYEVKSRVAPERIAESSKRTPHCSFGATDCRRVFSATERTVHRLGEG
jgi:hypothetical protein